MEVEWVFGSEGVELQMMNNVSPNGTESWGGPKSDTASCVCRFGRPRPDSSETKEGTRLGILLLGEARGYRDGGRRYEVTGLGSLCPAQDLPPAVPVPLLVWYTISHLGPRSTHRQRLI